LEAVRNTGAIISQLLEKYCESLQSMYVKFYEWAENFPIIYIGCY